MASQSDPEPSESPFVFEIHTNHNVLPPSEEDEHRKTRIAPDILQFIVDQNEVDNLMLVIFFLSGTSFSQSVETLLRRAIVKPNPVDASLPLTDYFISYVSYSSLQFVYTR